MSLRTLAIATTAFAALVGPIRAHAAASPFTADVVFGDSLSDDGNLSLALGSPVISRFTTNPGTVGAEDVAAHFGLSLSPSLLGGTDFASPRGRGASAAARRSAGFRRRPRGGRTAPRKPRCGRRRRDRRNLRSPRDAR